MKPINYAQINSFQKKGYWFKIWMEFLRPLLAKTELICQQLAIPQDGMAGDLWGGLAIYSKIMLQNIYIYIFLIMSHFRLASMS